MVFEGFFAVIIPYAQRYILIYDLHCSIMAMVEERAHSDLRLFSD